jgi:predicted kinase
MKLILTKGLPGCGKTTWSKEEIAKNDTKLREKLVIQTRNELTIGFLKLGKSVIWDDTNLNLIHETKAKELAKEFNSSFEIKDFTNVDLKVCIERDRIRPNSVGKEVIINMYNQYLKPKSAIVIQDLTLPKAVIFDIDGTIAKMNNRSPYEWLKVDNDIVYEDIVKILRMYLSNNSKIILMSGRDSLCKELTIQWLNANQIPYDELFMRNQDDARPDTVIKEELLKQNVLNKYYVECVYDDRNSVVEMWRSLGLRCVQVQEGNF